MIIPAETIKLKDMKEYLLRSTEESDAEQLASFIYELHTECPYMVNTLDRNGPSTVRSHTQKLQEI